MNTLGMIARADNGGLGAQTYEFHRHMKPERTLIVYADHKTRGDARPDRFTEGEVRVRDWGPRANDASWLGEMDMVWSAETWYEFGNDLCRRTRTALHANPEMYGGEQAELMWVATGWRKELVPGSTAMLFPVATDVLHHHKVEQVRTFYHVHSIAMCDRNGTELLMQALPLVRNRCRLLIRGLEGRAEKIGNVEVTYLGWNPGLYHEAWPVVDCLVLPRRFGGLCLPIQEAYAQGVPVICLQGDPYQDNISLSSRVAETVRTKGGMIDVLETNPAWLADAMDTLMEDPDFVRYQAGLVTDKGSYLAWDYQLEHYYNELRGTVLT